MSKNRPAVGNAVSFADRLAASAIFDVLFKDGMALVEETAAYLDGPGREVSRALPRTVALAYASESMRLTTRLMQMASWLLLQRAVNEGEMSANDALHEKSRSRSCWEAPPKARQADEALLPSNLLALIDKSHRLLDRVRRLDLAIAEPAPSEPFAETALDAQRARLHAAFSGYLPAS